MLCNSIWGIPNPRDVIERPAILPCRFIFGDCLKDRFSFGGPGGADNGDATDRKRWMYYDRELWYRGCKHTMVPHKVNLTIWGIFSSAEGDVSEITNAEECRTTAHNVLVPSWPVQVHSSWLGLMLSGRTCCSAGKCKVLLRLGREK